MSYICKRKNAGRRERRDAQEADRDSPQDSSRIAVDDEEMEDPFWRIEHCRIHLGHSRVFSELLDLSL